MYTIFIPLAIIVFAIIAILVCLWLIFLHYKEQPFNPQIKQTRGKKNETEELIDQFIASIEKKNKSKNRQNASDKDDPPA